ncbi:MAG: ROK family protein [Verrucomicrobia bacterium]|nr:ROK family protein [Verrucomicrobiota bacterium]
MHADYILGLDLGGTSVKGVALGTEGLRAQYHQPFDLAQPRAFAEAVRQVLDQAVATLGNPRRVGLSAPGIAARDNRSIAFMPGRFAGLEGLIWGEYLNRPDGVSVLNDANAALVGEVAFGAGRGASNAILLTLGTGVGGAIMMEGRLLRGHTGKAGHLGHATVNFEGPPDICQAPGSLEDALGNHNIRARTSGRFETTHALIRAVESGDAEARRLWLRSVRALAAALASFGNVLDPEVAIIGGGIARGGETLFGPLRAFLEEMEWRPGGVGMRLVPAELGELAGAYGAAVWERPVG